MTERIILQAPCPVLTVGKDFDPEAVFTPQVGRNAEELPILVPVDFGPRSRLVTRFAARLAEFLPHPLLLLHVLEPGLSGSTPTAEYLDGIRGRLLGLVPDALVDRTRARVELGKPAEEIIKLAAKDEIMFVLMPAHVEDTLQRLVLGKTAAEVVHKGNTPVMFSPRDSGEEDDTIPIAVPFVD